MAAFTLFAFGTLLLVFGCAALGARLKLADAGTPFNSVGCAIGGVCGLLLAGFAALVAFAALVP